MQMNEKIFNELEILTITYKSHKIIEKSLSKINKKFKITVVENSSDKKFKNKIENFKNRKCILTGSNLGFGADFNIGAKRIKSKYILHINPDAFINNTIIYELYKEANKIKHLGILSPIETSKKTEIKNCQGSRFGMALMPESESACRKNPVAWVQIIISTI